MKLEKKQINKEVYSFSFYYDKKRWISLWHQIDELSKLSPENILEIGPGAGTLKAIGSTLGLKVHTLDFDPELEPDYVASATKIPIQDNTYDIVCAFQMLEHLPFEKSLSVLKEMTRVSKSHIIISLPDAKKTYPLSLHIPKVGVKFFHVPKPHLGLKKHSFDGQHYWEINKKKYPLEHIISEFSKINGIELIKTYRVPENTYHRFFIFNKKY